MRNQAEDGSSSEVNLYLSLNYVNNQECMHVAPLSDKDHAEAFVIADSRLQEDGYDVLLRTITVRVNKSTRGNFSNKAVWLVVKRGEVSFFK